MSAKSSGLSRRIQFIHGHPRLWIAVAAGIAGFFFLTPAVPLISRMLLSWDIGVVLFLTLIYVWMTGQTADQICSHYIDEDPSGPVILVIVTAAALLSLLAVIEPLATLKQAGHADRVWRFAIAAVTLMHPGCWCLPCSQCITRTCSTAPRPGPAAALSQDGKAGVLGLRLFLLHHCRSLPDGRCVDHGRRHAPGGHPARIVSFAFNVAILGFAINITAGLMSG